MLALEMVPVDEKSIGSSGTSEPGALNTTLTPKGVTGSTGLCCQNILRPRQRLCDGTQTSGFKWAMGYRPWSVKGSLAFFSLSFFSSSTLMTARKRRRRARQDSASCRVPRSTALHLPTRAQASDNVQTQKAPSLTALSSRRGMLLAPWAVTKRLRCLGSSAVSYTCSVKSCGARRLTRFQSSHD
ncbi:hypothetical protein LZ30DRAFT_461844 [Colletotrichum cereale]|nr:hypothetical protein LZ30DRAFT_461844 [Colletotrichum cereale]